MARVPVLADHDEPLADQAADRVVERAVRRELAAALAGIRVPGVTARRRHPSSPTDRRPGARPCCPASAAPTRWPVRVVRAVCEIGPPPQLQVSRARAADRVLRFVETYGLLHPRPLPAAIFPAVRSCPADRGG